MDCEICSNYYSNKLNPVKMQIGMSYFMTGRKNMTNIVLISESMKLDILLNFRIVSLVFYAVRSLLKVKITVALNSLVDILFIALDNKCEDLYICGQICSNSLN